MNALAQAGQAPVGNIGLTLAIFAVFVALTLVIVYRTSHGSRSRSDYFAAGGGFSGAQNGIALTGDYLSAASVLGFVGAVAYYGYDGFLYPIIGLLAWLVVLLLVCEMLRNTGRFTMGDVMAFRMQQRPVRAAASVATLTISFFYLIAQMAGAGALLGLLLQIPPTEVLTQALVIAGVGALMIVYVLVGGMKGTTYVQIFKATLVNLVGLTLAVWLLGYERFDLTRLLSEAVEASVHGEKLLEPGLQYPNPLDLMSSSIGFLLGTAALPHILIRFYTVPDAKQARRSAVWAIGMVGTFYLCTLVIGLGAVAVLPPGSVTAANQNNVLPLLALKLGGELFMGIVAAVAFATILAVVAGLTITASASFAHDFYANVIKRGRTTPEREVQVARMTAIGVGVLAIFGGILANGQNIGFLAVLALQIAAAANLPTILYSLYWPRFNTTGTLCSIYGGLTLSVVLIVFSPAVSGKPVNPATGRSPSMLQGVDFHWFPLDNPALVAVPASFLLGIIGTFIGEHRREQNRYAEMEVRALTGAGASRASGG